MRDAEQGDKVAHLLKVWQQKLSYRLVRAAEESKIALSDQRETAASLAFIAQTLQAEIVPRSWKRRSISRWRAFLSSAAGAGQL